MRQRLNRSIRLPKSRLFHRERFLTELTEKKESFYPRGLGEDSRIDLLKLVPPISEAEILKNHNSSLLFKLNIASYDVWSCP
ncbi:hypothetical protein TNCV_127761 [Trichonephila clavipes]|nr:hypothetical protein TNCV_127761 [Trichonephila clavipes]